MTHTTHPSPPAVLHIALAGDGNERIRCWTADPQEALHLRLDGVPLQTYDRRMPMPADVTPAMVEAAQEAYCPFGDMELAIRAALHAAPPDTTADAMRARIAALEEQMDAIGAGGVEPLRKGAQ